MLGTFSSYFNKITRFFNTVEKARKPCKRSLHEISDDEDEPPSIQPYQPLYKKSRPSMDEPMMPVRPASSFKSTLHWKTANPPSLTPIKEDELAEKKERKFFKNKRPPDVRKAYPWQSTRIRESVIRLFEDDDTPSTSKKLYQPKLTTLLEHRNQGTNDKPVSKMCEKSQIKKKTASWPRNILGRSNYSNVNKRCCPLSTSKGKPNTIAESFRIEEKRQYQQLLHHCSLNQSHSPQPSSRSISRKSSTSSNSSSPFIYDVRWSRSSSSHSSISESESESECENTSPISTVSSASKRVAAPLKLLSNADKTANKTSSQDHKTHHHTSSRVQIPLSDITMKKKFRNSPTKTNESVISGSLFEEDDSLDKWIKHRYPIRKKCSPIPVIDLSLTDTDSLESMKDSDNESIEIVDEFSKGREKNNLLEELLYRKKLETQVSPSKSHDYHSTSGPGVDSMNRDENVELEIISPSQILHNKVEVRVKRLGVIWASPERRRPVGSLKKPFAPLTPEMQDQIDAVLIPYPKSEVLIKKFNISITRRDITTLNGLNWLNDEVINFYMNLIMERSNNKCIPKVYVFSTFFYPKLYNSGHKSVSRWTKKVDIFTYDILLIPIHLDFHWCMAIVDFKKQCINYYDSMLGDNNICLQTLLEYLEAEHMDKKNTSYVTKAWKLENMKNIPEQMNGSDCGVFSCKFAEYKSRLASLDFKQEDMPYFRRQMVYEIINGKLLE